MLEDTSLESPRPRAECSSHMEPRGKAEIGAWTANLSSCLVRSSKHYVPSSPPNHLEPAHSHGDVHYDTTDRPQSPVWNPNERQINSDQSVRLDTGPTEVQVSDEAAVEVNGSETESAPCAEKITLKALLEKIRQEKGTDQVDILSVCFGEPGVDLNVHIQGDFTVTLLI
ncbi:hypothetical protein BDV30DRAFT_99185 [Aspergillus minisclerotigenes]|uniref:Uncharacterized protein n=1 Tax=Aspergillus minisclerotigenes TaxID=656917 RepID=A0A5N6J812_9EURO|nr:hypothetical protein BDV30DRAFT_99185 [Aspergillus minisclerotigenes]